jgi:glycosyltransferase involved in cell wall biosynthesis
VESRHVSTVPLGGVPFSIICLSSQRWATALPTNRQQIMTRAARRGHRVLFVETADFIGKRLAGRRHSVAPRASVDGVEIKALQNLVPFSQRYALANQVNFRIGAIAVRRAVRALPEPHVLWIYDPRGAAAIGSFGEQMVVYDCVDDYGQQAGSHRAARLVSLLDRDVAARADLVFVTTERLQERHARARGGVHLVPNVGDFDHFRPASDRSFADPELAALPRPILGFAGNIIATKVDLELVEHVARSFPDSTVLLVGPAQQPLVDRVLALCERHSNIRWTGLRPYETLPAAVAAFDVALIPYALNEYTRSVFPLKVYEYLAAGKPVVAAGVPSIANLAPHVTLADDAAGFVDAIRRAAAAGDAGKEARMAVASANTWEHRAETLLGLVDAELRHARPDRD